MALELGNDGSTETSKLMGVRSGCTYMIEGAKTLSIQLLYVG